MYNLETKLKGKKKVEDTKKKEQLLRQTLSQLNRRESVKRKFQHQNTVRTRQNNVTYRSNYIFLNF